MRRFTSILLLIAMAFASCGLSAGLAESVAESELIGTWQFVGGGEIMGYGFRLNADGTGEFLDTDAIGMGTPKHLQPTGNAFVWHVDDNVFTLTVSGTTHTYPIARYDRHIHFAEGEGGGFYQKYDEEAIRTEIEERIRRGEMTEFDALAMDYIEDKLEPALAEKLHLRNVDAVVDWYSEEKSVTVSAWSLDLDHDLTIRFTESDTTVSIGTAESTWFTNSGIRIHPTADRYYQAARAALDQATEIQAEQQMLTGDVTPSGRELQPGEAEIMAEIKQKRADGTADAFDNLAMDAMDGTMTARLEAMGLTEISTRVNWEGSPRFILAWGWDSETHFRVALRFTPCAIGVCVGDEVGDVTQIPVSWYENYLRNPEVEIYENAYRLIQSELALA